MLPTATDAPAGDLDPRSEPEWAEVRAAGHRLVDHLIELHRGLRDRPCWQPTPPAVRHALAAAPPAEGLGITAALDQALALVAPYPTGNLHPRFWGWVMGGGNLPAILGDWLASTMNANVFAGDQAPVHLEEEVVDWLRARLGFPAGSTGLLVDGASMGTTIAMAVARHRATAGAVKTDGPAASHGLRLYASSATHNSVVKAAQLLGLGRAAVRLVGTRHGEQVDVDALAATIEADRAAGLRPFLIVGNAGTVGTGALDPLDALRDLADATGAWFHVDGAVAALAWMSPRLRPLLAGLDRADSVAFDLHKAGQVPYDAGCVLLRDGAAHRDTFTIDAAYLGTTDGGVTPHGSHSFGALGPQLSRRDRALKIWMTLVALGTRRVEAMLEQPFAHAQVLAAAVQATPALALLAPVQSSIVCFRYLGTGGASPARDQAALDAINQRLVVALQTSGFAVLSPYRVAGRACLRVSLANHRTRPDDLHALVARVVALGRELEAAGA